jgi:hypothetical protein
MIPINSEGQRDHEILSVNRDDVGGNRARRVDADTTALEFSPSLRLLPQGYYYYLRKERER